MYNPSESPILRATALDEIDPASFRASHTDSRLFQAGFRNLPATLKAFGFHTLRAGGQEHTVMSILGGVDSICIMSTAAGKTASFVIPAMCHDWPLLVFSPLKALMRDQVKNLQAKGIVALRVSSDESDSDNLRSLQDWVRGDCKILYAAPERLANESFMRAMRQRPPVMIAVDEAHTLSAWGDNFRHSYQKIGDFIDRFNPRVVTAFTATFSRLVERDVRRVLRMPEATKIVDFKKRLNLLLSSSDLDFYNDLADRVRAVDGPTLVYSGSREKSEKNAQYLSQRLGIEVGFYHSEVAEAVKKRNQDNFFRGKIQVMCCTNAFGMGIDKEDVRAVFHTSHPGDPEALFQEIGRAGRDGKDSVCHTYSSKEALRMQERFINQGHPPSDHIRRVIRCYEAAADSARLFHLTGEEIAQRAGVPLGDLMAIQQTLLGCRVIEDANDLARVHRLNMLGTTEGKWFGRVSAWIHKHGQELEGALAFDLDQMAAGLELGTATLMKYFRQWEREGAVAYEPPPRGKPKRLIGGAELVDYDRLEVKRRLAWGKLDYVKNYFEVRDEDKHQYLEDYFLEHMDAEAEI